MFQACLREQSPIYEHISYLSRCMRSNEHQPVEIVERVGGPSPAIDQGVHLAPVTVLDRKSTN